MARRREGRPFDPKDPPRVGEWVLLERPRPSGGTLALWGYVALCLVLAAALCRLSVDCYGLRAQGPVARMRR